MSTLTATRPTVKATTLEIRSATYEARPIDPGFAGVAAVEITKLVSGESYAVVLGHDGAVTCECPDFVVRHADKGTCCKHGKAALEHGLLVVPEPAKPPVNLPEVAPITPADRKRAAYFGLRLPVEVEAPRGWGRPDILLTDDQAAILADAIERAENPATETPDTPDFLAEPAPTDAIIDVALPDLICDAYRLRREVEAEMLRHRYQIGIAGVDQPAFAPTAEMEAEWSGQALQLFDAVSAAAPSEWGLMRSSAFRIGQADGLLARYRREDEEREWQLMSEERLEHAFAEPGSGWHEAERVESVGCIVARMA